MPRRKREASPTYELDDDYEDDGSGQPPIQRNAANARERARMRVLSSAFCRLKTKLPWVPPDTKLSKLDTLRLATGYIQQLQTVLAGDLDDGMTGVLRPPTLVSFFFFKFFLDSFLCVEENERFFYVYCF